MSDWLIPLQSHVCMKTKNIAKFINEICDTQLVCQVWHKLRQTFFLISISALERLVAHQLLNYLYAADLMFNLQLLLQLLYIFNDNYFIS